MRATALRAEFEAPLLKEIDACCQPWNERQRSAARAAVVGSHRGERARRARELAPVACRC